VQRRWMQKGIPGTTGTNLPIDAVTNRTRDREKDNEACRFQEFLCSKTGSGMANLP